MKIILYGLKQKSKSSNKTYYRDFRNFNWVENINENCLLSEKWLVEEIGEENWKGNYELVTLELDELLDQERETKGCIEIDYNTWKSEAETIIKLLLWDLRNKDYDCVKDIEKAEEFIKKE